MLTYSNARRSATIEGWPYGQLKTIANFAIETKPGKGDRAVRTTINPKTGNPTSPKALTYCKRAAIVDGSDGRTYIACLSLYGLISIMQGNMQLQQESMRSDDARYPVLRAALGA